MTETEKYVETKQETTTQTTYEPEFKPFTFEGNSSTATEYEIEKQYTFDTEGLKQLGEMSRQMDFATIDRTEEKEQEIVAKQQIVARQEIVARPRLNARGKIMLSVYSIIVAIIVAFCIYNAVCINSVRAEIANKNVIVATQNEVINGLEDTYNRLGDEEEIKVKVKNKLKDPEDDDVVEVEGFSLSTRPEEQKQTNWFEEFCQKLKKLFS